MAKTLLVLDEKQKCGLWAAKEAPLHTVNIFWLFPDPPPKNWAGEGSLGDEVVDGQRSNAKLRIVVVKVHSKPAS